MFIKKKKPNKRVLFNKFFIDPWSSILLKRKIRNRSTQRFLQFFSKYISYRVVGDFHRDTIPDFRNKKKTRRVKWWLGLKRTKAAPAQRAVIPHRKPQIKLSEKKLSPYKNFLLYRLRIYSRYKNLVGPTLAEVWARRFKKNAPKLLLRRYTRHRPRPKRYIRLKRKREYRVTQLMDLVFQQYHFGFSTLSSFGAYIKKHAREGFSWKTQGLGVEGMLANQICRAGLVGEIFAAYILVRGGAVLVNDLPERNPRRQLRVGDSFRIVRPFAGIILEYFKERLRKRKVVFNIMPYFECNLRLMAFRIWRRPYKRERSKITYFPFSKNELDWGLVKHFRWVSDKFE